MKKSEIQKAISKGTLIKKYPESAKAISSSSFIYNGGKYVWSSDIGYFIRII